MNALALLSGGLDSCLAACLVRDLGVEVEGVTFELPFSRPGSAAEGRAFRIAAATGLSLRVLRLEDDYMSVVSRPRTAGAGT